MWAPHSAPPQCLGIAVSTYDTRARQSETQGDLSSSSLSKYQGERGHWARGGVDGPRPEAGNEC